MELKNLFDMTHQASYTQVLFAALDLDIFSQFERPRSHVEVAETLSLDPENTGYFLDALAALDFIEKSRGIYKNTNFTSNYLCAQSENYIGGLLKMRYKSDIDYVSLVKNGAQSGHGDKNDFAKHESLGDYNQILKMAQKVVRCEEICSRVIEVPEFKKSRKMLDLGGGAGLIGIELAKRHPDLTCVIFDMANATKVALESVKEHKMEERVEVMTGDYSVDPIGSGYDLILASGTFNFVKHNLDNVMKKIHSALNPNGVCICISEGLTEERTKPKEMVINWLPNILSGADFGLLQGEVSDAALRAGFRSVHKTTVDMLVSAQDVDVMRK